MHKTPSDNYPDEESPNIANQAAPAAVNMAQGGVQGGCYVLAFMVIHSIISILTVNDKCILHCIIKYKYRNKDTGCSQLTTTTSFHYKVFVCTPLIT